MEMISEPNMLASYCPLYDHIMNTKYKAIFSAFLSCTYQPSSPFHEASKIKGYWMVMTQYLVGNSKSCFSDKDKEKAFLK